MSIKHVRENRYLEIVLSIVLMATTAAAMPGVEQGTGTKGAGQVMPMSPQTHETLPKAVAGTPYSAPVKVWGGIAPFLFKVSQGQLPTGLVLNSSNGVISGTPAVSGSFQFGISVADRNQEAAIAVSLWVANVTAPPPPVLSITTTALSAATDGLAYSFSLSATGGTPPYRWALSSGQIPAGISLSSEGVLSGSATQAGQFSFTVEVTDAASHQSSQALSLLVSSQPAASGIPATFFGIHVNHAQTPMPNVPVGSVRMWDDESSWAQTNTASGVYDWTTFDSRVQMALAANADILYDFARTPVWAQCSNKDSSCGSANATISCNYAGIAGEGGSGQCFPPSDLKIDGSGANQHWIDWVTAVALRYKGRIKYYEIWNEPSIPAMWQGTDAQLVRMTQDARCVILGAGCNAQSNYTQTAIDPSARITSPGFVAAPTTRLSTALDSYLKSGGGQYVDVIAFHAYVGYSPNQPELVVSQAASVKSVAFTNGQQNKPLFNTEGSWGGKTVISDQDQQVSWLSRYLILQQSSGLARSYWYSWDGAATPLWSKTGGTEIGGTTYGEVSNWLVGASLTSPCAASGSVWSCAYTRAGGYKSLAVWDASQTCSSGTCTTSNFTVPSGYVYSRDLAGIKTRIGGSTVPIGSKPILLENQ